MEGTMKWLLENWVWLLPLAVAVLSAINAATQRWDEVEGPWYRRLPVALVLFLTEIVSFLSSKGHSGPWKLPGNPKGGSRPDGGAGVLLLPLALAVGLSACGTWQETSRATMDGVYRAAVLTHQVARDMCRPTLSKCIAEKENPCPALNKCHASRLVVAQVLRSLHRSLTIAALAVEAGDQGSAESALAAVAAAVKQINDIVKEWT
jgi:hypothetical protein